MVISLNFFELMNLLSCFQVPKKYEKKLNIWFVHLQVILTSHQHQKNLNLRICFVVEFLKFELENLRGVHLPRSCQKKPVYRPLEEKWRTKRLSCLLSHRKQKEVNREVKKAKRSSNQIKRVKENAWMLKLGEVC